MRTLLLAIAALLLAMLLMATTCVEQEPATTPAPTPATATDAVATTYEPCAKKSCGDSCKICPPTDKDCVETMVLKFCQADGTCDATEPDCS